MVYLLGYLGTILISGSIQSFNKFLLIKDMATECNKVDIDMLVKKEKDIPYFNFHTLNYQNFIPFYNVFMAIQCLVKYYQDMDSMVDDLKDLGIVYPMAIFERFEYQKKLNFAHLLKVLIKGRKRLLKANCFETIEKGEITGQAYYEGKDNINVLETKKVFDNMPLSDIKNIIRTNDENHLFSNFIHQNNGKIIVVKTINQKRQQEEYQNMKYRDEIAMLEKLEDELLQESKDEQLVKKKTIFR